MATITDTGILSVIRTTTINGAPTLSVTVAIGGAAQRSYTPSYCASTQGDHCRRQPDDNNSRVKAKAEETGEATAQATSETTVGPEWERQSSPPGQGRML